MKGKVALVTGGASGIGAATAALLADEGAKVVVTDVDASGERVAAHARQRGGEALFMRQDVAEEDAWRAAVARTIDVFGQLDVLVNNAGISDARPLTEMTLDEWHRVLAVNLDGVFLGLKHGILAMRRSGGGSIVNVSSVAGLVGTPGAAAYSASKGGVRSLTKTAALECAKDKIRVNSIHPGGVKTPLWQRSEWWGGFVQQTGGVEAAWKTLGGAAPLGRMADAEEIARAIAWLASDEASYVTGAELAADGGYTAQ
jgi:NAD(P)-dependent dehydrogenase (short-subunit alcohol dehydrogenase family)